MTCIEKILNMNSDINDDTNLIEYIEQFISKENDKKLAKEQENANDINDAKEDEIIEDENES